MMLNWIATHPVTMALVYWLAFVVAFSGGIYWLWVKVQKSLDKQGIEL